MLTPNAPPEALVKRFGDDLTTSTGPLASGSRIGIAVSGGPDSLALLLLARAALPGGITAATVNHGLRPEAADEADMIARVCADLDVPHVTLVPDESLKGRGNIQERARIMRYGLLGDWAAEKGISIVATAHHCDDVAETLLMRAMRGAGVSGLARMKSRTRLPYARSEVMLVRPLLNWRRAELMALVRAGGLTPVQDPSNQDQRFDRARIRALLQREPELDPLALARSAANLGDADTAIEWMVQQAWRSRADQNPGEILIDAGDLPVEIRRRLAAKAVAMFVEDWNGEGLDRLMAKLDTGGAGTLAGVRATGGRMWRFSVAPPRREHR